MLRQGLGKAMRTAALGVLSASPLFAQALCSPRAAHSGAGSVLPPCKPRGALIVFEGVDRAGKTTQARKLVKELQARGEPARFMRFPDRTTSIGKMINAYLTNETEVDDRCIHLLFSANRWEAASEIRAALDRGESVIVDRYAYSGAAFSMAKGVAGMDGAWCAAPDEGLPQPDRVLFLRIPAGKAQARGGFGEERYERSEFQERVLEAFADIRAGVGAGAGGAGEDGCIWEDVDAVGTVEEVAERVMAAARPPIEAAAAGAPIRTLWGGKPDRA